MEIPKGYEEIPEGFEEVSIPEGFEEIPSGYEEIPSAPKLGRTQSGPELVPSHTPFGAHERARDAEAARVEEANREAREYRGIGKGRQMVEGGALSILGGVTNLAKIPGALAETQASLIRRGVRAVGGDKAAEVFGKIQPYLPAAAGGSLGVAPVQRGLEAASGALKEAAPATTSPIIKDPETGEEFLNRDFVKDPNFWISVVGEELAPIAVQIALAKMSGGASAAAQPALLAKLAKAGKVGKLAAKFLGSGATKAMVGFEAARTLPSVTEDAKKKYMEAGDSEAVAQEKAATWGSLSSALQGAVGGAEVGIIKKAMESKARSLIGRGLGYLATAIKEGGEEAVQSLVESAVAKMSYDPKLTLDNALRSAFVEGTAGAAIGTGMHTATRGARVVERNRPSEFTPAPESEPAKEPTAFREATPEEAARVGKYDKIELAPEDEAALSEVLSSRGEVSRQYPDVPPPSAGESYARTVLAEQGAIEREARIADQQATSQGPNREALVQGMGEQDQQIEAIRGNREALQQQLDEAVAEIESGRTKDAVKAKRSADRLRNEIVALQTQEQMLTEGITLEDANALRQSSLETQLTEAESLYNRTKSRKAKAEVDRIRTEIANPEKWSNTRQAWEDLKAELSKPGVQRGALGDQTNPDVFGATARLMQAAIQDGYRNASEWLADLRNRMPDFREFYREVGGVTGATALWNRLTFKMNTDVTGNEVTVYGTKEGVEPINRPSATVRVESNGDVFLTGIDNKGNTGLGTSMLRDAVRASTQNGGKDNGVLRADANEAAQKMLSKFIGFKANGRQVSIPLSSILNNRIKGRETGAIGKDVSYEAMEREKIKRTIGDKEARRDAYETIGAKAGMPSMAETQQAIDLAGKMLLSEVEQGKLKGKKGEFAPAFGFMSPAAISMRSRELQDFNNKTSAFLARKENIIQGFNEALEFWAKLDAEQQEPVSAALLYGTIADDGKGHVWTDAELKKNFPKMTPEGVKAYRETRRAIDEATSKLRESEAKLHNEIKAEYEALLSASKDKAQQTRIKNNLKELEESYRGRVDALNNKAYFPLNRNGDYRFEVTDQDGKRLGMTFIEENSDEAVTRAIDAMAAQDKTIREMRDNGTLVVGAVQKNPDLKYLTEAGGAIFDGSMLRYLAATKAIDDDLMASAESEGKIRRSLLTEIELAAASAWMNDSFKQHLQHRTGLPGYSMDGLRALQSHARTVANRVALNDYSRIMDKAVNAFSAEVMGNRYDPNMERQARDIYESVRNPPVHPTANALMSLAFISNLGYNLAFTVTNLTQQGVMGLPVLGNFYGYSRASKAMARGDMIAFRMLSNSPIRGGIEDLSEAKMKEILDRIITPQSLSRYSDPEGLVKLLKAVLHDSARNGELRPKVANDIMTAQEETLRGVGKGTLEGIAEWAGLFASKSEQQNRIAVLVASTILAHEKGIVRMGQDGWRLEPIIDIDVAPDGTVRVATKDEQISDARQFAEFMNRIINFSGGRGNLAPYQRQKGFGGGVLRVTTQFKRFLIDQLSVLHNLGILNARTATGGIAPKAAAYVKPWLVNHMVTFMLAGSSALPFWMVLKALIRGLFPEDYAELLVEARQKAAQIFNETLKSDDPKVGQRMAFYVENGLPNLAPGVNLNAALTPNLFFAPESAGPAESLGYAVAGAGGGMALKGAEILAKHDVLNPDSWEQIGMKVLVPRGVQKMVQAAEGKARYGGQGIELKGPERLLLAFGFTPTRIGEFYQNASEEMMLNDIKFSLKAKLRGNITRATDDELDKARQDAMEKVKAFNATFGRINPKLRLDFHKDVWSARGQEAKRIRRIESKGSFE